MRDLINIVNEAGLTQSELVKHGGKYLDMLYRLADAGPVQVVPEKRAVYGETVQLSPETIEALRQALEDDVPLPKAPVFIINKQQVAGSWGALFKGPEFTGLEEKKSYNAGHLSELFMGLATTATFFNFGEPISVPQLLAMFGFVQIAVHQDATGKETSNFRFSLDRQIKYSNNKSKNDNIQFIGVTPAASAQAFVTQAKAGVFPRDIQALLASAVRYVNESESVKASVQRVMKDPNSNQVNVTSDGTTDAKGTKADLILSIDGTKVNLLSLKTYGSDTMGQVSGHSFERVEEWFRTSFGIDLLPYQEYFDGKLSKEQIFNNIFTLYDRVVYPKVQEVVDGQRPGKEAKIVQQLAFAANFHARGNSMEDVEVVKLSDSLTTGEYKILRFSDSLYDVFKHLDLTTRYIAGGAKGRTIQIWVKPSEGEKTSQGSHRLCQFRSQVMGGYLRNFFEIGPMMVALTQVGKKSVKEDIQPRARRDTSTIGLGRERR